MQNVSSREMMSIKHICLSFKKGSTISFNWNCVILSHKNCQVSSSNACDACMDYTPVNCFIVTCSATCMLKRLWTVCCSIPVWAENYIRCCSGMTRSYNQSCNCIWAAPFQTAVATSTVGTLHLQILNSMPSNMLGNFSRKCYVTLLIWINYQDTDKQDGGKSLNID